MIVCAILMCFLSKVLALFLMIMGVFCDTIVRSVNPSMIIMLIRNAHLRYVITEHAQ